MIFSHPHLAALALSILAPLAVRAQNVSFTNNNYPSVLAYGQSFTLTWSGGGGSVSIGLAQGPEDNLQEVTSITPSYVGGNSYTWTPSSGLPAGAYVFTITEADNGFENFSPSFCVSTCYPSESSTTASATSIGGSQVSATAPATSATVILGQPLIFTPYPTTSATGVGAVAASGTGAVYYPGATGAGSTYEGSGNVLEFTGGAMGGRAFGVGAIVAGVLGGMMMML